MRSASWLIPVALLVAACSSDPHPLPAEPSSTPDPYPLPAEPPNTHQYTPSRVGEPNRAVVLYIEVRPGDRIKLLGAEAIGSLDGASVRFLLSPPVIEADGTHVIGKVFEDFEGAMVTAATASPGPDNAVGIAVELTPSRPGRYEITNVRLRYRINGGGERTGEGIHVVWTVCADVPTPADCPDE